MEIPILITDRLLLQPTSFDYEAQRWQAVNNQVTHYMTRHPPQSIEEAQPFRQLCIDENNEGSNRHRDIVSPDASNRYGAVDIRDIHSSLPNVGIWIAEKHQGQGFAYEALSRVVEYYFSHYATSLVYTVALENTASQRLVEKVGGRIVIGRTGVLANKGLPTIKYIIEKK